MSWFKLKEPMGSSYRVDPVDIKNTKRALNVLGYYNVPSHRGIDDWTDDAMFDGIRRFQKANGLKVDGFMRPDGPTELALNRLIQRQSVGAPRFANLGDIERASMCACTSSDDNPWGSGPDDDLRF